MLVFSPSRFANRNYGLRLVLAIMASKRKKQRETEEKDKLTRIAIVNKDRCKPKKCALECKQACPVNRMGKLCIEVTPKDKV